MGQATIFTKPLAMRHGTSVYDEIYPRERRHLTRQLKAIFDPEHVLNRDLDAQSHNLKRLAAARANPETKDIVLLSSNIVRLDFTANLVANLAAVGVHSYVILGDSEKTCAAVETRLACVWSSILSRFSEQLRKTGQPAHQTLWLVRQIYFGRLAALGYNPMLLDADVVLFANPFKIISSELPDYQAYLLNDVTAGNLQINGGTLYLRNADPNGPVVGIWKELERRVFDLLDPHRPFPTKTSGRTRGRPAVGLLFDQNLVDSAAVSIVLGNRSYQGRGSPAPTLLNASELRRLHWSVTQSGRPTPAQLSRPGLPFASSYALVSFSLQTERLLMAPPWLFAAESSAYRTPARFARRRVHATLWGVMPPPTVLVHFVCTRFPFVDGRKTGSKLLGRWFGEDIKWALEGRPSPAGECSESSLTGPPPSSLLIAFASTLALPRSHHASDLPCRMPFFSTRATLRSRRSSKRTDMCNAIVEAWHALLAAAAFATGRVPVLPIFECAGFLRPASRNSWALYTPSSTSQQTAATKPTSNSSTRIDTAGPKPTGCVYRVGQGCFKTIELPEAVAAIPAEERLSIRIPAHMLLAHHGFPTVLDFVANQTLATPKALLLDVADVGAADDDEATLVTNAQAMLTERVPAHFDAAGARTPCPGQNTSRARQMRRTGNRQFWMTALQSYTCQTFLDMSEPAATC